MIPLIGGNYYSEEIGDILTLDCVTVWIKVMNIEKKNGERTELKLLICGFGGRWRG